MDAQKGLAGPYLSTLLKPRKTRSVNASFPYEAKTKFCLLKNIALLDSPSKILYMHTPHRGETYGSLIYARAKNASGLPSLRVPG